MHLTIHKLVVLRNEIHMYKNMLHEREILIEEYNKPLQDMQDELAEVKEQLKTIRSPASDGLGGYVQEKDSKYNSLITKKDELPKEIVKYVQMNEKEYLADLDFWNVRIATVEYYLSKMDALDRKFIEDFHYNLSKKSCMIRYNIKNVNSLYRKSDNILKNLLKK